MATKIGLGQLVTYRLTAADVAGIMARRETADANRRRLDRANVVGADGQDTPAQLPAIGSPVAAGDAVAAIVVKAPTLAKLTTVNLRLVLDGFDGYWVQNVNLGVAAGTWSPL